MKQNERTAGNQAGNGKYNAAAPVMQIISIKNSTENPENPTVSYGSDSLGDFLNLTETRVDYVKREIKLAFTDPNFIENGRFTDLMIAISDQTLHFSELTSSNCLLEAQTIRDFSKDNGYHATIPLTMCSFPESIKDKLVSLTFGLTRGEDKKVVARLYGVADQIPLYAKSAIIASRTVQETKPGNPNSCTITKGVVSPFCCTNMQRIVSLCNNFMFSEEIGTTTSISTLRDTLTHRILDFDGIVRNQESADQQINQMWAKTDYAKNASKRGDNGRVPLLLIHGWQGDKWLRSPAKLGQWGKSELHYFQHFLDYYLATPKLQNQYHIYLYHYPTYKHVTYNAKVLTDLLTEIKANYPNSDLAKGLGEADGSGMTILAHSMGGLVSRSAIEEYAALGTDGQQLKRLITLDTPHHGSVLATPTWVLDKLNKVAAKDLYTQGSASLQWDNFDAVRSTQDVGTALENRSTSDINSKQFDAAYQADVLTLNSTNNPWLSYLNKNYEYQWKDSFANKYILYVAWMNPLISMFDTIYNGPKVYGLGTFDVSNSVIQKLSNLPGGGAEQVTSALWNDKVPSEMSPPFNPQIDTRAPFHKVAMNKDKEIICILLDSWNVDDWFAPKTFSCAQNILISKKETTVPHPYGFAYRIFWDYDHEKMVGGAYGGGEQGGWDKYIKEALILNDGRQDITKDSSFLNEKKSNERFVRDLYIETARAFKYDNEDSKFSGGVPAHVNPLKQEPVFMVLERDLLDAAK